MSGATRECRVSALFSYPIKSARGCAQNELHSDALGIVNDRRFMFVNEHGRFVSQREFPLLTQVIPLITDHHLDIRFHEHRWRVPLSAADRKIAPVTVWRDEVQAVDCGDELADALSSVLQKKLRLVMFGPHSKRLADAQYSANTPVAFSDGFPILVANQASLQTINDALGVELQMERFRPNVVVSGLDSFLEDKIARIEFTHCTLTFVKPCVRCSIPSLNPVSGQKENDPSEWLKTHRFDRSLKGATFGSNAVMTHGVGATIHVGEKGRVVLTAD